MDVIVRPHPLSSRGAVTIDVPEGASLTQMVAAHDWPAGFEPHVCALINGEIVPREWWPLVHPKEGAQVTLALRLQGGGGGQGQQSGSKTALRLVAVIVLTIVSQGAGSAWAGTLGLSSSTIAAGVMLVGTLALNALFKPPSINAGSKGDQSNAYSFSGQSNQIRPYGVIPRVLGTHRMFGDVAANPYTELVGNDQYLVGVLCFGYGPCELNDIRIGENPIDQYRPELVIHKAFAAGDQLQLYTNDVLQEGFAFLLNQNVPVVVTTRPGTDQASFDLAFQSGLGFYNPYRPTEFLPYTAGTRVEFKRLSEPDTAWKPYSEAVSYTISEGNEARVYNILLWPYGWSGSSEDRPVDPYAYIPKGTTLFTYVGYAPTPPMGIGSSVVIAGTKYRITATTSSGYDGTFTISPPFVDDYIVQEAALPGGTLPVYYTAGGLDTWEITRQRNTPFLASMSLRFPDADQWQIRVTQLEPDQPVGDQNYLHKRVLSTLRSMTRSASIVPDKPVCLLEYKIKATDQLSGVIGNMNALVSARVRGWNGSAWVPDMLTSNPAWLYLELLQGPANNRPIADERIDLDALKAWAVYCDTVRAGFTGPNARCNFVVDTSYTLWQLLSSVAANGRATPTMKDNKYSVIVDSADKVAVQVFTPRNSWGLSARRKYVEAPDALRVKWIDPQTGYTEGHAIVYNDGFDEHNAAVFEDLQTFGVTSWEQAHREGRITLARGILQQEEFSISADVENIICTRGDMIGIAHDVMEVGGWSARLRTIAGTTVTFDADLKPFDPPLAARHRSDNGVLSGVLPMAPAPGQPGAYVIAGLPASAKVGDLVVYGTVARVLGNYLVKGIQPGDDLTAEISCIEYAPGVYEAEAGPIPAYVPQKGSVGSIKPAAVISLSASHSQYFVGRFPFADVLLRWSPPTSSSVPPSLYIVNEVRADGTAVEIGRTSGLIFTPLTRAPLSTTPYGDTTVTYEVVPQWPGIRGPASRVSHLLPLVSPQAAGPLSGLTATPHARGVLVTWEASTEPDLAYYVVRYGPPGATWEAMAATEQKIKANRTDLPPVFLAGTWQVAALQESTFGPRGPSSSVPFTILAPIAVPITGTAVQNTAFLRWGTLALIDAGTWSAQTTFQIEYYDVIKQRQASTLAERFIPNLGIIPAGTVTAQDLNLPRAAQPQNLGRYAGEFAVMNEQQEGLWQYCVRGVDLAGNQAPYACVTLLVNSPDNYFLLDHLDNVLPTPECLKTNAVLRADGLSWLAPVDTAQTWKSHYESHAWDQPADQVAAGFPIYAQPAEVLGTFSWTHDYLQNLPSLRCSVEAFYSTLAGTPDVDVVIYAKANAGDAWTLVGRNPIAIVILLPPGTRFVRVDVEVDSDAANKAFAILERVSYTLDVQFRDDSGTVTTPASGSAVVTFNVPFIDVRSVQLTSADPAVAYARYEVASNQRSMTVYTFNATAAPVGGKVAWLARGV